MCEGHHLANDGEKSHVLALVLVPIGAHALFDLLVAKVLWQIGNRRHICVLLWQVQREGTVRFPAGVRTERSLPLLITRRVFVSHQGATVWCLACAQPSRRGSSATTSLRPLARMVFGRRGLLPEPWKSRSSL